VRAARWRGPTARPYGGASSCGSVWFVGALAKRFDERQPSLKDYQTQRGPNECLTLMVKSLRSFGPTTTT